MSRTAVDTSALIALLYPDNTHNKRASKLLHQAYSDGALLIAPIVYTELAADPYFATTEDLDTFLDDTGIVVDGLSQEAQFLAGESFRTYLSHRGEELQCSECGHTTTYDCPSCSAVITSRQHIATDFLIGAHAEVQVGTLLTFDHGFYREYFDIECMTVRDE